VAYNGDALVISSAATNSGGNHAHTANSTGSNAAHTHSLSGAVSNSSSFASGSFSPLYVDAIVCTKA